MRQLRGKQHKGSKKMFGIELVIIRLEKLRLSEDTTERKETTTKIFIKTHCE